MEFEQYIKKQKEDLDLIVRLDAECKKKKQIIGRYVTIGLTDRTCFYVVVDESPRKCLLRFACGETVHPEWGHEIRLTKRDVMERVKGRDFIETIFPPRN